MQFSIALKNCRGRRKPAETVSISREPIRILTFEITDKYDAKMRNSASKHGLQTEKTSWLWGLSNCLDKLLTKPQINSYNRKLKTTKVRGSRKTYRATWEQTPDVRWVCCWWGWRRCSCYSCCLPPTWGISWVCMILGRADIPSLICLRSLLIR